MLRFKRSNHLFMRLWKIKKKKKTLPININPGGLLIKKNNCAKLSKYSLIENEWERTAIRYILDVYNACARTNQFIQTNRKSTRRANRSKDPRFFDLSKYVITQISHLSQLVKRKAKVTSSVRRREPAVFAREAAKAIARPRVCLRQKLKVFRFSREKVENARIPDNLSLIQFNAADVAIIVAQKVLFTILYSFSWTIDDDSVDANCLYSDT